MPNAQPSPYSDTTTSPRPRTFGLMPQDVDRFAVHLDNGHGTGVPSIATCEKLLLDAAALVSMWIGDVDVLDQEGSLLVMEAAQALACGKGLSDFSKMLQEFARHRSDTFRAARVRAMAEAAAQSEAQPVAPTPPRGRVLHVVECWGNRDGRIFAGDELLTEQRALLGGLVRELVARAEDVVGVAGEQRDAIEAPDGACGGADAPRIGEAGVAKRGVVALRRLLGALALPAALLLGLGHLDELVEHLGRDRAGLHVRDGRRHDGDRRRDTDTGSAPARPGASRERRPAGILLESELHRSEHVHGRLGKRHVAEDTEHVPLRLDGQETKVFCAAWERAECCSTDGAPRYNVTFVTAPEHARRQWMRPFVAAHAESLSAFYGVAARFLSEAEVWAWAHFAGKTADLLRLAADHRAMDRVELEELAEAADEPAFALRLGPFALDLFVSRT